jgi:hypothetical protein
VKDFLWSAARQTVLRWLAPVESTVAISGDTERLILYLRVSIAWGIASV